MANRLYRWPSYKHLVTDAAANPPTPAITDPPSLTASTPQDPDNEEDLRAKFSVEQEP
ncbi:hypothetical protein CDV36_002306 [Fusarium kuroshium]|uniref:Uncharacterized protein n=2 Tax=Fusarium solani species complex TaxID=232080 RepID=A0A3M2SLC6_9HYPO|nr:hypothetical protein CDV36_002306 [Fusarium kuroshium]RSM03298.1 hypothetical protein CEP52_007447 [Fusarium oligoseptatum]